jgi:hypothetical protein
MTAILLNDGEIAAVRAEKSYGLFRGGAASRINGCSAKKGFVSARKAQVLHPWQRIKVFVTRGFFAFAKFF